MAGFNNYRDISEAFELGQKSLASFRKVPNANTSGIWFDTNVTPGNPPPFYYASSPGVSAAMSQPNDGGINHGPSVSPKTKFLKKISIITSATTGVPLTGYLCDYLLYYPFIEESSTDPYVLTNSATLPRYTDGEGVQVLLITQAARTGGQTFNITYTNSNGVAGRTSVTMTMNTSTVNGNVYYSQSSGEATLLYSGPFLPLQAGDTGVRSVESFNMVSGPDVGLTAIILVKPLATFSVTEQIAPSEFDFGSDRCAMPVIQDEAYLSFLAYNTASFAGNNLLGILETIWV